MKRLLVTHFLPCLLVLSTILLLFAAFILPTYTDGTQILEWKDYLDEIWTNLESGWDWSDIPVQEGLIPWSGGTSKPATADEDVILIYTPEELAWVAADLCNEINLVTEDRLAEKPLPERHVNKYINREITLKLMADLDLNGANQKWMPFGYNHYLDYTSAICPISINGNGKTIYNMHVNRPAPGTANIELSNIGLMAEAMNNSIWDLTLVSPKVIGSQNVGGIAGHIANAGAQTLKNIRVTDGYFYTDPYEENRKPTNDRVAPLFPLGSCVSELSNLYSERNIVLGGDHVSGLIGNLGRIRLQDSYTINSYVIGHGAHSAGLISCAKSLLSVKNCFANASVYGSKDTAVLIGATLQNEGEDSGIIENCYATGFVEGGENLAGFMVGCREAATEPFRLRKKAVGRSAATLTIQNCYSTAIVGMQKGGKNMGSFIADANTEMFAFMITDCYATGETGGLDPDMNQNIGGFAGTIDKTDKHIFTNCFYDKQTTTLKLNKVGKGPGYGITGLLTNSSKGNAAGLQLTGMSLISKFSGGWYYATHRYPELEVFHNSTDPSVRAYSAASVATPLLEDYDDAAKYPIDLLDDAECYDTLKDIARNFSLTDSTIAEGSIQWSDTGASGVGNHPVITLSSDTYYASVNTVGIEWLTAYVTIPDGNGGSVTGNKPLRIIPTKALFAGPDAERHAKQFYDLWDEVMLINATPSQLADYYYNGNTNAITPVTVKSQLKPELVSDHNPSYIGSSPWITDEASFQYDYFSEPLRKLFEGETPLPVTYVGKTFTIRLSWPFPEPSDKRFLQQQKTLKVLDAPASEATLHLRQVVLDPYEAELGLPKEAYIHAGVADSTAEMPVYTHNFIVNSQRSSSSQTFTEVVLSDMVKPYLNIKNIIPQYYQAAGYIATPELTPHNPANRVSENQVQLSLEGTREYWITLYIIPVTQDIPAYTIMDAENCLGDIDGQAAFCSKAPKVLPVKIGDLNLKGTGVPNATIQVVFPDLTIKQTVVNADATWSIPITGPLSIGTSIQVTQTEPGKQPSSVVPAIPSASR